ncbi:MAG: SIMPL domain-containing protein [Candidatus Diapherotrites archaeon]
MDSKNVVIIAAAVVIAVLVLVIGFNFNALTNTDNSGENKQLAVQLPSYLSQGTTSTNEGAVMPASEGVISFAADDSGNQKRLLSVSGTITKTAAPDEALIYLSIETLDKSASKSQSDNAVLAGKVMTALKNAGIAEDDIETTSYNLSEDFEYNSTLRKSESVGYRTTNSIQVTVKDLSKTGSVIDAAVQAGANRVSGVTFALSKAVEAQLKTQALQEAAANAKVKAQSIASGLGIGVGQVFSASESSNYVVPMYRNYALDAVAEGAASAPTPITPGDIEYSATVSVQFEIV